MIRSTLILLDEISYYLTIIILGGLYAAPFIWSLFK